MKNWCNYTTITGDVKSKGASNKKILVLPRKKIEQGLLQQFERNPDYLTSIDILGYTHP